MITRVLIILIAFFFMVTGLTYMIIYTNLFSFGYTIKEYIIFLLKQPELYLYLISFFIELLCIFTWKGKRK